MIQKSQVLNRVKPGMSLGSYDIHTRTAKQYQRYDEALCDPLPWYRKLALGRLCRCSCTVMEYLWGYSMNGLGPWWVTRWASWGDRNRF